MSNPNPELVLLVDESDPSRSSQQCATHPTKKKSGFVITSVTDSGHGRPLSIVRDGEESADDLDESHASYSDVSYSRTTDIDHDQESTASEDTLNISAHEPTNVVSAEDGSHINQNPATSHHPLHQTITRQHSAEGSHSSNKPTVQQDAVTHIPQSTSSNVTAGSASITNNNLQKQNCASLESPQELPHDNNSINGIQEEKSDGAESVVENHSSHGSGDGKTISSVQHINTSEQNHDQASNASTTSVLSMSEMTLPITSANSEQSVTSVPITQRTPTVSDRSVALNKAPGTRVYKVVKRDTQHPVKRTRGRWTWYDFTDNQAPRIGSISLSETKLSQDSIYLHQAAIPFGLSQSGASYEQLIRSGFPVNGSFNSINFEAEMKQQFSGDISKTGKRNGSMIPWDHAMTKYTSRTTGETVSEDMSSIPMLPHKIIIKVAKHLNLDEFKQSASSQNVRIDNKIEAAMDLVKKHLMSAVKDEVDELKEKIKDLEEENVRLRNETQRLRSVIPNELQVQVGQIQEGKDKDNSVVENQLPAAVTQASSTESSHQQTPQSSISVESSSQKCTNLPQSAASTSHLISNLNTVLQNKQPAIHQTDSSVKPIPVSATQSQRKDLPKMVPTKSLSMSVNQSVTVSQGHKTPQPATASKPTQPQIPASRANLTTMSVPMASPLLQGNEHKGDVAAAHQHDNTGSKPTQTPVKVSDSTFNKKPSS